MGGEVNIWIFKKSILMECILLFLNIWVKKLQENYNGKNVRKLAKELDYSERWVQSIINRNNIKFR